MSRSTIRTLILSMLSLLIAVGSYTGMAYVVHKKERTLQEQLSTLNDELAREDSFYKLQRLFDDSKQDRELLRSHFLGQESDSIDVLNWIEDAAPKAGVNLETKGLQKITEKDTKNELIEASFSFSGRREDVERFASILEKLPYLSYITSLSLTARSSDNWEALVTLRVYIYPYDK